MKYYMGVDPGIGGGIAILNGEHCTAYKMPKTLHDIAYTIYNLCQWYNPLFCYVERVHSMPKQGVSSTFKFGENFGILQGVLSLSDQRFDFVNPGVWQRSLGCIKKDKNFNKGLAQRLYPKLSNYSGKVGKDADCLQAVTKVTHAVADAILIAEYTRRFEEHKLSTKN